MKIGDTVQVLNPPSGYEHTAVIEAIGDCGYGQCTWGDDCVTLSITKKRGIEGPTQINRPLRQLRALEDA